MPLLKREFTDATQKYPNERYADPEIVYNIEVFVAFFGKTKISGELRLLWHANLDNKIPSPQLIAPYYCWMVLWAYCGDLPFGLSRLDGQRATPDQIKAMLRELGFEEVK